MELLGIIPARYGSTRFPGKPLAVIDGRSMIRRVWEQAGKCTSLKRLVVATDHELIARHVEEFGGEVVMTATTHRSGTERCAEVLDNLGVPFDAVVNIQGDEPYIDPEQIELVAGCFRDPSVEIATLVKRITTVEEIENPNVVKVVVDRSLRALYFSRATVPYIRNREAVTPLQRTRFYKHIGIYGYRSGTLKKLVALPESMLEKAESLEQLRWLEHGFTIRVQETDIETLAIDTPADLLKITNTTPGSAGGN
jgi:3-deoxy-manno-octulosonate cytidylyltransferase (CMP-KDO synthetase)